jgi:predicted transcriptional regulator
MRGTLARRVERIAGTARRHALALDRMLDHVTPGPASTGLITSFLNSPAHQSVRHDLRRLRQTEIMPLVRRGGVLT